MRGAHRRGFPSTWGRRWTGALRAGAAGVVIALGCAGPSVAIAQAGSAPIGAHSMLEVNSSYSLMQEMFSEAAGMHAGAIRVDVAPVLIFPNGPNDPNYRGLDEIMGLAQQYHLRVVANLFTIPTWLADCPAAEAIPARCGTDDLGGYSSVISKIVQHSSSVIHDWEIWNEPDSSQFFTGTPQQYAGMLRAAHDAIKQIDPQANVLLGGISSPAGASWLDQVFAALGVDAVHAFDIANVHERASLDALLPDLVRWRWFLASRGFTGPLWVTEHGYPADPAYQYDPAYTAGPASQAAYLTASIPTLLDAGAGEVFVTEHDSLGGQFASEGVLAGGSSDPPGPLVQRPAYAAVAAIADCYLLLGRNCPSSPPIAMPVAVTMPGVRIGSSSSAAITVSDLGSGPLQLGSPGIAAGGSPQITVEQSNCPAVLEPNNTCLIRAHFAPVTWGEQAATLELPSDSGPLSVPISAAAPSVASLISPQLSRPTFTPVHADGVGYTQRLVLNLTNPLSTPVQISRTGLDGAQWRQFHVAANACTKAALAPGASCELPVLFQPTRIGTAHAVLTLHGDGQPLPISLRAVAHARPAVTLLDPATATCFSAASANQVLVGTSQAATVTWRAMRYRGTKPAGCAGPPGGRAHRWAPGRSGTTGHAATSAHRLLVGRQRSYLARFRLPVRGGSSALRPGVYELTVTATNGHGSSHARTLTLTVGG